MYIRGQPRDRFVEVVLNDISLHAGDYLLLLLFRQDVVAIFAISRLDAILRSPAFVPPRHQPQGSWPFFQRDFWPAIIDSIHIYPVISEVPEPTLKHLNLLLQLLDVLRLILGCFSGWFSSETILFGTILIAFFWDCFSLLGFVQTGRLNFCFGCAWGWLFSTGLRRRCFLGFAL